MSNANLESIGVKYVIDDSEVKAAMSRITQQLEILQQRGPKAIQAASEAFSQLAQKTNLVFNEKAGRFIDTQTRAFVSNAEAARRVKDSLNEYSATLTQIEQKSLKFTGDMETSHRSIRFFAYELTSLSGSGGLFAQVVSRMVFALSPLDAALIGVVAAAQLFKTEIDKQDAALASQEAQLARTATSFDDYVEASKRAAEQHPISQQNIVKTLNEQGEALRRYSPLFDNYVKGFEFWSNIVSPDFQKNAKASARALTEGELALGQVLNDRIAQQGKAIQKSAEEGASLSELYDQVIKLKVAEGEISEETLKDASAMARLAPALLEAARAWQIVGAAAADAKRNMEAMRNIQGLIDDANRANAAASRQMDNQVGRGALQFLDAQQQFNEQQQQDAEQHQERLAQITADGEERRADIARSALDRYAEIDRQLAEQREEALRSLQERLAEIEQNATERRAELAEALAERIADAEANAQENRQKLAQSYADRRVDIEKQYQERVRQINQTYADSIFETEINRDAKAIVVARRTRDRQLADAAHQRDEANAQAAKDYQKQQNDLDAALAKQKAALQRDYQRQLADLAKSIAKQQEAARADYAKRLQEQERAAAKARAAAAEAAARQFADLERNLTKSRNAENENYRRRQQDQQRAYEERLRNLARALAREGDLTDEYVTRVQNAFKKILDPHEYQIFIRALQDAFNAQINVKITTSPGAPPAPNPNGPPGPYAAGGMVTGSAPVRALLHPPELVLPFNDMTRTNDLVRTYLAPRMSVGGGAATKSRVDVYVHPELNEGLLSVKVRAIADDQMVRVFSEAGAQLGVGNA